MPEPSGNRAQRPAPEVMGVLNLTPDSFSDGGRWSRAADAVPRALQMVDEGASIIDLGAESTRPGGGVYGKGAAEVSAEEELERLLPVLTALRVSTPAKLSVDTRKAEVAKAAIAAGADMINDVGGLRDPEMTAALASCDLPVVLMHSRGELGDMQRDIRFTDVVHEVRTELAAAAESAIAAGIARDRIILDPGIGFGKTGEQNLRLLKGLPRLRELGFPLLIGASRKAFIGEITGEPATERLAGSLAAAAWAAAGGASVVRVHDVAATCRFLDVWAAIGASGTNGGMDGAGE